MSFRRSLADQLLSIAQSVFPDAQVHPAGVTPSKSVGRYLTYQRISAVHARHLGGGTGLANPRYTVTAWSRRAADANRLPGGGGGPPAQPRGGTRGARR